MEYEILILVCIVMLGLIGLWFAYKFFKKKQEIAIQEKNVPQEILDKFNQAEEKMKGGIKEDGTTENPYGILWEIARGKSNEGTIQCSSTTEPTVSNGELCEQSSRRQDIQTRTITDTNEDKPIIRKSKPNNFGRIISRIRGRNS